MVYYPRDLDSSGERILKDLHLGRPIECRGQDFSRPDLLPVSATLLQGLRRGHYVEWDDRSLCAPVRLTSWGAAIAEYLAENGPR